MAKIIWARTENNKPIPIDFKPTKSGNIELTYGQGAPIAVVFAQASLFDAKRVKRYVSHFVTCPDAREHRKE